MAIGSVIPRLALILSNKFFHKMNVAGLSLQLNTLLGLIHESPARGYLFLVGGFRTRCSLAQLVLHDHVVDVVFLDGPRRYA